MIAQFNPLLRQAVILTALEPETRAVLRHIPECTSENVRGTEFHVGQSVGWNIAVAEIGAGNSNAAAIVERAIEHFRPVVALFLGVAGGIKDVAIGDVVVATKVYGYEAGKDKEEFLPRPDVFLVAHSLEQRARVIRLQSTWKSRLSHIFEAEKPGVYIGSIAAGEKVVADSRGAIAEFLRKNYSDALAVEMEGRGFLQGVHINPPVLGCVIRGISDLLSAKSEADGVGSQSLASDACSAFAFEMLATFSFDLRSRTVPDPVEVQSPISVDWTRITSGVKSICEKIRSENFVPEVFISTSGGGATLASLIVMELSGWREDRSRVNKLLYVMDEVFGAGEPFDSSAKEIYSWGGFRWFLSPNPFSAKPHGTKALFVSEYAVTGSSASSIKDKLQSEFGLDVKTAVLLCNSQALELSKIPGIKLVPDYYAAIVNATNFDFAWYPINPP